MPWVSHGIVSDNRLIFTALKEKDGKAAEEAMVSHLQNVEEYLAEKEEEKVSGTIGEGGDSQAGRFKGSFTTVPERKR